MEEWRAIVGHDGYEVSNLGNVRSPHRVLKGVLNQKGYARIFLKNRERYLVSRLAATAFIPNPDGKPEVDHIDRNPANNVVSNLRWATRSEQNLNKESSRPNTSGERNIRQVKSGSWKVQIVRESKAVMGKSFPTLAEAVAARDRFLDTAAIFSSVEDGHSKVVSH